ncbi:MAG: CpsD/CapB family tyrosine-protein kinase [Candidatus Omnitrophica bacterium]|nr:CpsD/CapB family tyrosine-protein kinase [Candidatus Omnitrophota bacterium]
MGKITDALKKAAQERLTRLDKIEQKEEEKYQFVVKKTVDSKIDPRIVAFYDPKSPVVEQYRTLRSNIQAINSRHPVKAITVTSSIHGEGKTITSINLAISMAHDLNKKQILLVDGDMRRASVKRYLGINPEVGLADLIANGAKMEDALLNIGVENLTILPAGKVPHNPAELLNSLKLKNLISMLREKYDYIIFDSPPIIPVTDAGLIGSQTDGVVMVIKANKTQKGIVHHSESLLKQVQAKVLGYVLTNIQYHIPDYIYRYL